MLPPRERQRVVGGEVAGPGLEGRQVAVLRLHVAVKLGHVMIATYSSSGEGSSREILDKVPPNLLDSVIGAKLRVGPLPCVPDDE